MKVEIPHEILRECIDANILQTRGSLNSVESRSQEVQRLTYQVGEYVVSLVAKEMQKRKMLPPPNDSISL